MGTDIMTPEQNLWLHVLLLAIYDANKGDTDAMDWIFTRERKPKFRTFPWVCRILDMDPKYVRRLVERSFHDDLDVPEWL